MAQKSGADSFLAPSARQASARVLLALAVVASILLGGCGGGGGSSEDSASEATATQTGGSTTAGGASSKPSPADKNQSASANSAKQSNPNSSSSGGSQGQGKHGSQIKLPEGEPEPQATPAEQAEATVADIALSSPALGPAGEAALPSPYTCDGKDSWPELDWQGVPDDSAELVLFAMNVQPIEGKLFFDWALAGIPPSLTGLEAGKLPAGAVQGKNSFGKTGYSICPPQGQGETYVFALYALPKRLSPAKGFDPRTLREEAQAVAGHAGLLAVSYAR